MVPIAKRSILVLRLSILFYKIYIIKAHSVEVSKKRNAALTTTAYYNMAAITAIKSFIVQGHVL